MPTIVGLAGSLRRASLNAKLLSAAAGLAPPGTSVLIESIREIPLYDGDVEAQGIPAPVTALKDRIAAAAKGQDGPTRDGGDNEHGGDNPEHSFPTHRLLLTSPATSWSAPRRSASYTR